MDARRATNRNRNAAAFTLVEALVVIAIIAVVAALVLGVLSRAQMMRERTACAVNLRQVGNSAISYTIDHRGALPTPYFSPVLPIDSFWMRRPDGDMVNLGLLLDYSREPEIYYCPTQTKDTSPALARDSPRNPWRTQNLSVRDRRASVPIGLNSSFSTRPQNGARWAINNFSNKVVYSDFIGVRKYTNSDRFRDGIQAPHEADGYNRLVGDGAVHWLNDSQLDKYRRINNAPPSLAQLRAYYKLFDVLP